jgi:hypothetical protein
MNYATIQSANTVRLELKRAVQELLGMITIYTNCSTYNSIPM